MNISVSMSGPLMGDISISREAPDMRMVQDGPDMDAEACARALEQIAAEIRRMFPKGEHDVRLVEPGRNDYWNAHCRCGWYATQLGREVAEAYLAKHIEEAS